MDRSVYLMRPISGHSYDEVTRWYELAKFRLSGKGFDVWTPMTSKEHLRCEKEFKSHGYGDPVSSNHAIFQRDAWMARNCSFLLCDLTDAKAPSIGCVMELATARESGKAHSVVVMQKDNCHRHAFVLEAADVVFETLDEALLYLGRF